MTPPNPRVLCLFVTSGFPSPFHSSPPRNRVSARAYGCKSESSSLGLRVGFSAELARAVCVECLIANVFYVQLFEAR